MQMKDKKKSTSFILCMALTVAMALFTAGCNGSKNSPSPQPGGAQQQSDAGQAADGGQGDTLPLGEGNTIFHFTVVDKDGVETAFEIHTDESTVGAALLELGLIAGDESDYGLFVKTVNGVTADYDKDGVYWAFYAGGEYALTGVDATAITEGESYSFRME